MFRELRVEQHDIDLLSDAVLSPYNGVGIRIGNGREKPFPETIALQCRNLLARIASVKVELPVLFQSDMQWLAECLEVLGREPISLVCNDWGTLYKLNGIKKPVIDSLYAGRWLSYSFYNTPGHESILAKETNPWMSYNISNESTLKMLEDLGVSGIEVDAHPEASDEFENWRKRGFRVCVFDFEPLASLWREASSDISSTVTVSEAELTPKERWVRFDDAYIPISQGACDELGKLYTRDHTVRRRVSSGAVNLSNVDSICTDWHRVNAQGAE